VLYLGKVSAVFSPEWFEQVITLTEGIMLSDGSGCRIQFDLEGTRFGLIVDGGRVKSFARGDIDDADLELRFTRVDGEALWRHELRGDDAMRAATVVTQLADGMYCGAPAPGDLLRRPEFDDLPRIAEASLVVAYTFRRGPFGLLRHWFRFEDGRPVDDGFGEPEDADVRIEVEFRAIPLVRSGEQTILDGLEGGSIDGALGPIAMLAGILEAPEFRAAELASGRHAFALATLGELWADDKWTGALEHLAADARPGE
jgi:hypothetical protein